MARKSKNKKKCERYRLMHTRETNKARKLKKHLELHPNDKDAQRALKSV